MSNALNGAWFAPADDVEVEETPQVKTAYNLPALKVGSPLARALYSVWSQQPVTIVKSPPGAGKTTLITQLATQLFLRSDMTIGVLTPTNSSGSDLVRRLVEELGQDEDGTTRVASTSSRISNVDGASQVGGFSPIRRVEVSTVASMLARTRGRYDGSETDFDLLIIDEAYQCTFSDIARACDFADQILLVGDPGQIGPVVTINTAPFEGNERAPHIPAPVVFERDGGAEIIHLESTFRLGQTTVEAIGCLYDFEFDSLRVERTVKDKDGNERKEIESVLVQPNPVRSDLATMDTLVDRAQSFIGGVVTTTENGQQVEEEIRTEDVAIIVSHVDQTQTVRALLDARGMFLTQVGTADSLQGSQWKCVVALDPLFGHAEAGHHSIHSGRLCVMASRHMAHLSWVHDGQSEQKLKNIKSADAIKGRKVRKALTKH